MKKIKMVFMATASFLGLVGAFAFKGPNQVGGWLNGVHYIKGQGHNTYSCNMPPNITCTYQDQAQTTRFDTGTFVYHP